MAFFTFKNAFDLKQAPDILLLRLPCNLTVSLPLSAGSFFCSQGSRFIGIHGGGCPTGWREQSLSKERQANTEPEAKTLWSVLDGYGPSPSMGV